MTDTPAPAPTAHLTPSERAARGKAARAEVPRSTHGVYEVLPTRRDPIELLVAQEATRVPELVPIRHGRMLDSAFAFYRGAAIVMAADLASTATSGLHAQVCGDAHVANFGVFASPERHLVFDVNDFDETLPGPWEWDVKRLTASLAIAGRGNGFTVKERRVVVLAAVSAYRTAMRAFAPMTTLDVWYAHLDVEQTIQELGAQLDRPTLRRLDKDMAKARSRDNVQAFDRLTTVVDGERRIVSDPPLIVPIEELLPDIARDAMMGELQSLLVGYEASMPSDRRHLIEQFELVQVARKVVGVGSVGTRAWILLFLGSDEQDPLFLQAKEAEASVLEEYAGVSRYENHGERVVAGQHLMQAASDIFLGWEHVPGLDGVGRDFYIRQLRDWKGSADIARMVPAGMAAYARMCGWTLARAHARSGDRIAISAYLGGGDAFDRAIAEFSELYADQNERDYAELRAAVADGRVQAQTGV